MDSYTHFFVTCIFIWRLKIWDSLSEPQASSFGERNNINYCQLWLIFGCLLHWTHCWRFSLPLIAWLDRANKLSVQKNKAMFHRFNDRVRKSHISSLPIHKTRGWFPRWILWVLTNGFSPTLATLFRIQSPPVERNGSMTLVTFCAFFWKSKGKSRLYCSTFDICQLILVVPSYVGEVLVCNWEPRSTGEHW